MDLRKLVELLDKVIADQEKVKETLEQLVVRTKMENKICGITYCTADGEIQDEDGRWLCDEHAGKLSRT